MRGYRGRRGQADRRVIGGWGIFLGCAVLFSTPLTWAQAPTGLDAIRVASGMSQPLFVTAPPGDYDRIFIVNQTGTVRILKLQTGLLNATPFLDISSRLTSS